MARVEMPTEQPCPSPRAQVSVTAAEQHGEPVERGEGDTHHVEDGGGRRQLVGGEVLADTVQERITQPKLCRLRVPHRVGVSE